MRAAIGTQAEGGRAAAAAKIIAIDPEPTAEPSRVSRAELSRAGSSPRHAELSRRVAPPSRAAEPRRQQQQSRTHKQNPWHMSCVERRKCTTSLRRTKMCST